MSFPRVIRSVRFPVPGCPAVSHSAGRLREHFMFRDLRSWIAVVQEGMYLLPCCDMCGIHMPTGWIIGHRRTARCDRNMQMRLRIRYVEIASKCTGETFSLMRYDGAECFEGVDYFKYLGRVLHQSDEDWKAVHRNIGRVREVWGSLGNFLMGDGADLIVSEKFYQAVLQVVLLFGVETWVLAATMLKNLRG